MLICLPLVQNSVTLNGTADRIQHIAVALAVDTFLKGLYIQTKVNLICSNVFSNIGKVGCLDGIQKYQSLTQA